MAQYESGFRVANPLNRSQVKSGTETQKNHKAIWVAELGQPLDVPVADGGKDVP